MKSILLFDQIHYPWIVRIYHPFMVGLPMDDGEIETAGLQLINVFAHINHFPTIFSNLFTKTPQLLLSYIPVVIRNL
jgi:pyrroloquinoline quinone (PQQ) biosynthesis protein C